MHIVLILLIPIYGLIFQKNRKTNTFFCGMLLFLYSGLRASTVGIDTQGYELAFNFVKQLSFSQIFITNTYGVSRDPIFYCFLKVLQFLSDDAQIMFITIGLIVAISVSLFIYRYSQNITLSFLTFVGLRFFYFTLTGLRAAIALSIILFAYNYLEQKKYVKLLVVTLIASLFHASAIIFILAIFIVRFKKPMVLFMMSSILFVINIFSNNALLYMFTKLPIFSQYSSYIYNSEGDSSGLTLIVIFAITTIGYYFSSLNKNDKKELVYYNLIFLKLLFVGMLFYILNFSFANASRMGDYFCLSIIVFLPNVISNLKIDARLILFTKILAAVLLIMQYIIIGPGRGTESYLFYWQI